MGRGWSSRWVYKGAGVAAALAIVATCGCGQRRWAVVNITASQTTLLNEHDVQREGSQVRFVSAVLQHEPQAMAGQAVDYWTQQTTVDCHARTFQLGAITAFDAAGRQLTADPGADPAKPLRPGSNEAAEADALCTGKTALPSARPGDLPALLHDFRTGSVLPGVHVPAPGG